MLRTMMTSKIHRATVTQADLHYVGSVTVDEDLLEAADLLPGELVHIVDVTNGARLETYTIAGERGSGVLGINGAAAHLVHPGDVVILIAYGQMETAEAKAFRPAWSSWTRTTGSSEPGPTRPRRCPAAGSFAATCTPRPASRASIAAGMTSPTPVSRPPRCRRAGLDHDRRRRRRRHRHRRPDRGPAAARPGRQGARRHQGRARPPDRRSGRRAASPRRSARGTPPSSTSATPWSPAPAPATRTPCGSLVNEGPEAVRELIALGANFDHSPEGELSLTREGGHHRDRIAHAGGDATGAEIQRALVAAVQAAPDIEVVEHALAVDLLLADDGGVAGITLHVMGEGQRDGVGAVRCRAVVLASGGLGQVFSQTTNPAVSTGDGMALALRAGAVLRDLEFVQFHPTVMYLGPDVTGPAAADQRGRAWRGRLPGRLRRRPVHAGAARAGRPRTARRGGQGDHAPDARDRRTRTCGSTRGISARGVLGEAVPDDPRDLPLARGRPGDRADPGRAGVPLRLRRGGAPTCGALRRARALRDRRGRLLRGARRQPARVQLPAGGPRLLSPDRAGAARRAPAVRRPGPRRADRPGSSRPTSAPSCRR